MNKYKARRRHQRAFFHWLYSNQDRLLIPIILEKRSDVSVQMYFVGINKAIFATLNKTTFSVSVEIENKWCGNLTDFAMTPNALRDKAWKSELFEPFLDWVNCHLAVARFVAIYNDTAPVLQKSLPSNSDNLVSTFDIRETSSKHIPIHLRSFHKMHSSNYSYYPLNE